MEQTLFPVDDWILEDSTEYRLDVLPVGYAGGNQFVRQTGFIKFELPADLSAAVLVLTPTKYFNVLPEYFVTFTIQGQEVGRDSQASPQPISVDITDQALALAGRELIVALNPASPPFPINYVRFYGSMRGSAGIRPLILLEVPGAAKYPLSVAIDPLGSGVVSLNPPQPVGGYDAGTMVTLTATPNQGYVFDHWSGNAGGTAKVITLGMGAAKSITAHFREEGAPGPSAGIGILPVVAGIAGVVGLGTLAVVASKSRAKAGR